MIKKSNSENYYSEIKVTFDDRGYTFTPYSDDAYFDAFSHVLSHVGLVEGVADCANDIDDPQEFAAFLAKADAFFDYLKAGGYLDSDYMVTLVNKRKHASKTNGER